MKRVIAATVLVVAAACAKTPPQATPTPTAAATPTGKPTTLQFRIVRDQHASGCPTRSANPAPDEPAKVKTISGKYCLSLGPAVLEVTRADTQVISSSHGDALHIALNPKDTKTFARVTTENNKQRIAVLAYGKVLIVPLIQEPIKHGELAIQGPKKFLDRVGKDLGAVSANSA